jgi:hypothetical protein
MGIEIVFEEHIGEAMKKIADHAEGRMLEAVQEVRNTTIETLSGSRTGRVYKVPGTNQLYTASSPGEAPAVQLGDLRKSVKSGVEKEGKVVVGFVGSELPKASMLEMGTSRMAARPWLRPSFEKSLDKVKEIMTKIWF